MADINQIITLGIGTPSDIEHFVLFGLNMPAVPGAGLTHLDYTVDSDPMHYTVPSGMMHYTADGGGRMHYTATGPRT